MHPISLDILYEICRWSISLYKVATLDRRFHEYMRTRVAELQANYTVITRDRNIRYFLFGRLHRVDGPAVIGSIKMWFQMGRIHRVDGPAFESQSMQEWYCQGKWHRLDGPAIITSEGPSYWYQHGELHRVGGPAICNESEGTYQWYQNGKRHRVDGPAVVNTKYGTRDWYLYGKLHRVGDLPLTSGDSMRSMTKLEKVKILYTMAVTIVHENAKIIISVLYSKIQSLYIIILSFIWRLLSFFPSENMC